jgi:hypothetical protein
MILQRAHTVPSFDWPEIEDSRVINNYIYRLEVLKDSVYERRDAQLVGQIEVTGVLRASRNSLFPFFALGHASKLVGNDNHGSFTSKTVCGGRAYRAAAASYNHDLTLKAKVHFDLL